MLITDHIGLVRNDRVSIRCWNYNDDSIDPRFPDMTHPYDSGCAHWHMLLPLISIIHYTKELTI